MDSKNYASSLSEAKIVADLTQKMFHIFTQTTGKAPFDLVAVKDNSLYRVQVKACYKRTTSNNKYRVQLGTVHTSNTKNVRVNFDATKCDILAIYLIDSDKIIYLDPKPFHGKSELRTDTTDKIVLENIMSL